MLSGFDSRRLHHSSPDPGQFDRNRIRMRFRSLLRTLRKMVFERGPSERDPFQRNLLDALRDPDLRANLARLQTEIFEALAPAADGTVVRAGRPRRGRLVFGDAVD